MPVKDFSQDLPRPPVDSTAKLWLRLAWLASGESGSGAVAARWTRHPDRVLVVAGGLAGNHSGCKYFEHRGAAAGLLIESAAHGICLNGAACFLWPDLGPAAEFSQLLAAGVREVCIPALAVPERAAASDQSCRFAAGRLGVTITSIPPDELFLPLSRSLENA